MDTIKRAIGHRSIATTMDVYGHLFPEDAKARIAQFSAAATVVDTPQINALR